MRIVDMLTKSLATVKIWSGGRWVSAKNAEGEQDIEITVHPPTGSVKNIGAGCAIMNLAVEPSTTPGMLVAARIPVVVDVENPTFEFDVIFNSGPVQKTPTVEIQAAVAVEGRQPVAVTFNGGEPTVRVQNPSNRQAVSVSADPTPIKATAGSTLVFYGFTGAPNGGTPVGDQHGFISGEDAWYAGGPNFAAAYHAVRVSGGNRGVTPITAGARPARILAPSDQAAWLLAGDSIIHFYRCHAQRWAMHAGVAWSKNATGGGTHGTALENFETAYVPGVKAATMVLDELGVNGANQVDAMQYWRRMRSLGIEGIVKTTITPRASTRDRWATVEGQTPLATQFGYDAWDAWLLDGAPMQKDWSAAAETGATGADIVRCAVVDSTGKIARQGDPSHIFGRGGVVDWNPVVSAAGMLEGGSRRVYRTDLGLTTNDYGDGLHFGEGIHAALGEYLIRAMPVVLDPATREA